MSGVTAISSNSTTPRITLLDEASSTITYVGKAAPNSDQAAPVWQVRRLRTVGNVLSVEYADGNVKYDNVWDDRASLSYA